MATKVTCDNCGDVIPQPLDPIRVDFLDGEHPHCGATMYKTVDLCPGCAADVKGLTVKMEWSDFRSKK